MKRKHFHDNRGRPKSKRKPSPQTVRVCPQKERKPLPNLKHRDTSRKVRRTGASCTQFSSCPLNEGDPVSAAD